MTRTVTAGLLMAATIVIVGWDIYAAIEPTPRDTVSRVILDVLKAHPSFAWVGGVVLGHFCSDLGTGHIIWSIPLLLLITGGITFLDFKYQALPAPVFMAALGLVAGYLCWGQTCG